MVNVLFAGNSGVFDGMLCCALSILKRSVLPSGISFFVLTMDASHLHAKYRPIEDAQIAFFERMIRSYDVRNRVVKIDVTDLYRQNFSGSPNEDAYCTPYTLLRLLADELPELPQKILYLDVDVLLARDVRLLYDIDVRHVEYAAARDHYGKLWVHPNYINAGVLLLNLREMKKSGILKKARALLQEKKLVFADQSALIRATTKKKLLPQKYNDQRLLRRSTVVRHFSKRLFWLPYPHVDNIKPWHVSRVHKALGCYSFDDVLYEYIYWIKRFQEEHKA